MAKGWRKGNYNREIFGQRVRAYRLTLQWSLGQLAQQSGMNKGTLQHVEKSDIGLPDAKRQALIDVLTEAMQHTGQTINRQEFLELAGLTINSTEPYTISLSPQLHQRDIPAAGSQVKQFQDMTHEAYAGILMQQQEWQLAATYWLLATQEAKYDGNWAKWSRCLLHAGLAALTGGQFESAERSFKEVMNTSQDKVSTLAVAEAYIRLGWVYYEQDKFSVARQYLLKSRIHLQNAANKNAASLHFPEHGCTLALEGEKVIMALEESRLHWLGRTYVDWGIEQDNQALLKEGVAKLQEAGNYDRKLGLSMNVGYALLRQIPALLYEGKVKTGENYVAQSEELLGTRGTAKGHIYLHKGLLALEERPEKAKDLLESAREGFVEPTLYVKGLAEVFKEISGAYLMDDRKTGDEMAFQYALATAILHPYGTNLALLQLAAHKMYWRTGENMTAFNRFWQVLEAKLWSMESEPFSDLRYLMKSLPENGVYHVETALEKAKKAIHHELLRKT
jgi:tetratricopeptide (TPR) repeat protein